MTAQTYTRRENARRAAIAAGIPKELVKITVHKTPYEVRFGWDAKEAPVTTCQPEAKPAPKPKAERPEQNGVRRPAAGGVCAAIWDYLDGHPVCTAKEIREAAAENGWNTNNAMCELYTWRKFNGISRRVKASAS